MSFRGSYDSDSTSTSRQGDNMNARTVQMADLQNKSIMFYCQRETFVWSLEQVHTTVLQRNNTFQPEIALGLFQALKELEKTHYRVSFQLVYDSTEAAGTMALMCAHKKTRKQYLGVLYRALAFFANHPRTGNMDQIFLSPREPVVPRNETLENIGRIFCDIPIDGPMDTPDFEVAVAAISLLVMDRERAISCDHFGEFVESKQAEALQKANETLQRFGLDEHWEGGKLPIWTSDHEDLCDDPDIAGVMAKAFYVRALINNRWTDWAQLMKATDYFTGCKVEYKGKLEKSLTSSEPHEILLLTKEEFDRMAREDRVEKCHEMQDKLRRVVKKHPWGGSYMTRAANLLDELENELENELEDDEEF